jgi:hypothetical protein
MPIRQASTPVNKQTTAIGVTVRRVIVEQIVPERGVAIVRDGHQYMTEIPYRVQAGRGRVPREGDYWYVDRSMGSWTFLAYIAKNDSDMTTYTEAMNFDEAITVNGPLFINNETFSTGAIGVVRDSIYDTVYYVKIDGDTFDRFRYTADGYHGWGPGNVAMDTALYRAGVGHLKTDGKFTAGSMEITGAVTFLDLQVNGDLNVNETLIVDGTVDAGGHLTANNGATIYTGASVFGNLTVTGDINVDDIIANDIDASGTLDITSIITNTLTATGVITPNSGITLPNGAWIKRGNLTGMTMQNGWGYHGDGFQNPSYTEFPDRTAGLFGVAEAGTTTGGTTISTIPAAIRPANDHVFLCAADGAKTIQIVIQAGGAVKIQNASAAPAWVSLGNCRWPMNGF